MSTTFRYPARDDGWATIEALQPTLRPLLEEIGRTSAPALLANGAALESGAMETTIDGQLGSAFPYQGRCHERCNRAMRPLMGRISQSPPSLRDGL